MSALLDVLSPRPAAVGGECWLAPEPTAAPFLAEAEVEPLAALENEAVSGRFRAWRGASGRRYIVSVYEPGACPAYCDAILIAAAVDRDGRRKALALADTGFFPEPVVARAARTAPPGGERIELHLHLLAATADERRAALDDLAAAVPYAARS